MKPQEAFENLCVAVTGGAGFIGFHLCETLLELGANLTIIDNLSKTNSLVNLRDLSNQKLKFLQGDIRDFKTLENETRNCELIFHLAAQSSVPLSMKDPNEDFEVNALGTLNVLESARRTDAKIIFTSTSAVYGNAEKTPTPEDCRTQPISFYGFSKQVAEDCCQLYREIYGLEIVTIRLFNVYGPRGHGVVRDFLNNLKRTPCELRVLGTGEQSRDFVYVSDVVRALVLCAQMKKAVGQTCNIGSGTTTRIVDLANIVIKLLDLRIQTNLYFTGGQAWEGDAKLTHADIGKAQERLGWVPLVELEDGLKNLINQKDIEHA